MLLAGCPYMRSICGMFERSSNRWECIGVSAAPVRSAMFGRTYEPGISFLNIRRHQLTFGFGISTPGWTK